MNDFQKEIIGRLNALESNKIVKQENNTNTEIVIALDELHKEIKALQRENLDNKFVETINELKSRCTSIELSIKGLIKK